MPTERISFAGHSGDALAARLDMPEGPHLGTALFAHCFTCSKDIPAARRIAGRLAGMGIAVLRFDFTGLGHSGGEFANTSFSSNVADLIEAARYLSGRGMPPGLLIGHSLGGAAVLRAAGGIDSAKAVATIGAPAEPEHVTHNFADALPEIERTGEAEVSLGGRPFRIRREFVEDVSRENLANAIAGLKRALLVLHAPGDATVGIENAARIFGMAKHPKSFVTLDTADHLISDPMDAEYAAQVISSWAGRYMELHHPAPPVGAPEGVVRVSEAGADGFLQDVTSGPDHHTLADEPLAYGGSNRGMSPYGFLSAGLGACTSMTIRMHALRKKMALKHVWVDVTHDKVHAQDADASGSTGIDAFKREIHLEGDLTDAERQHLLQAANRCPVHRTLEGRSRIETTLAT